MKLGRTREEAESFWDEWMPAEESFLADDRPWSRASLVICGTPPVAQRGRTLPAHGPRTT